MARYGIDRALLAAARPDTDRPANRIIDVPDPSAERPGASAGRAGRSAMRCRVRAAARGQRQADAVFGYDSDLERAEMLYTSLLIQMAHGLARTSVPATARSARAWRRSWLLGYTSAVVARVQTAEQRAASDPGAAPGRRRAEHGGGAGGPVAGGPPAVSRRPTRTPVSCA